MVACRNVSFKLLPASSVAGLGRTLTRPKHLGANLGALLKQIDPKPLKLKQHETIDIKRIYCKFTLFQFV